MRVLPVSFSATEMVSGREVNEGSSATSPKVIPNVDVMVLW